VRSYTEYLGFDPEELFKRLGIEKCLFKKLPGEVKKSGMKIELVGKASQKNKIGAKKLKLLIVFIISTVFVFFNR
jgi:cytoskeletal protein RodZ